MKADRFKIYFDMYYNSELPAILERETEMELKRQKENIIKSIKEVITELSDKEIGKPFPMDTDTFIHYICEEIDNLK